MKYTVLSATITNDLINFYPGTNTIEFCVLTEDGSHVLCKAEGKLATALFTCLRSGYKVDLIGSMEKVSDKFYEMQLDNISIVQYPSYHIMGIVAANMEEVISKYIQQ